MTATAHEIEKSLLESERLPKAAAELLVAAGGHARHTTRVSEAMETAWLLATPVESENGVPAMPTGGDMAPAEIEAAEEQAARAAMLCFAELAGTGGQLDAGLGSPSTERLPGFNDLGSGRRHASDGAAWTAAIREAGVKLANWATHPEGTVEDRPGADLTVGIWLRARQTPEGGVTVSIETSSGEYDLPLLADDADTLTASEAEWLHALSRRGVIANAPAVAGLPRELTEEAAFADPRDGELIMIEGSAQAWGAVQEAAEQATEQDMDFLGDQEPSAPSVNTAPGM